MDFLWIFFPAGMGGAPVVVEAAAEETMNSGRVEERAEE